MIRRPPRATRTDTRFPYTTLFRSALPVALGGDIAAYLASGGPAPKLGVRAGLFHPTTGYSLPDAVRTAVELARLPDISRSEEHTSELQSLMRISYAVFCLKKKKQTNYNRHELTSEFNELYKQ